MSYSPELHRKIELYAAGMLDGRELQEFEAQLEREPDLKREALFRKSVIDAIREVRRLELKNYIKSQSQVRLAANPWGKVWTIASIIIIVVAAAVYFIDLNNIFPQNNTTKENTAPVIAPIADQIETDTNLVFDDTSAIDVAENEPTVEYAEENIHNNIQQEEIKRNRAEETGKIETAVDTALSEEENNEEIIVKRDELLTTINLKVIDKSAEADTTENLSTSTIEKLNPEAKLPEPAPKQDMFRVELWKSPINFRGYRLVKNRLTLFGVEQAVILRLYRLDDELYLEYGPRQFSKLYPGDQFNAFVRVRDPEILSQLTQ